MKGDAGVDTIHFPTNHTYKKDLSKFEDHEIVTTHFVDGSILGTQKNGDVVVLGKTDLYDEVKKADPLDLAPSEFEPDYDFLLSFLVHDRLRPLTETCRASNRDRVKEIRFRLDLP